MKTINPENCRSAITTLVGATVMDSPLGEGAAEYLPYIQSGKMLRGLLVFEVGGVSGTPEDVLLSSAAAVEMLHAASLLHDDVIDGGELRRGMPAFWKQYGPQGAILLGDMLVFKSMDLVRALNRPPLLDEMITLAGEVCMAEVEQELLLRDSTPDFEKAVDLARRKTGALFAFAAAAGAGDDEARKNILRESGFLLGTAYQLADDYFDRYGSARDADKTLGTDRKRRKLTGAAEAAGEQQLFSRIRELLEGSVSNLKSMPEMNAAWQRYLDTHAGAALDSFLATEPAAG